MKEKFTFYLTCLLLLTAQTLKAQLGLVPLGPNDKNQCGSYATLYPTIGATDAIDIDKTGVPYVAFNDGNYGYKATVKKFVNGYWQIVGNPGFSGGIVSGSEMVINNSGVPYVMYRDSAHQNKATVMKFDGSNWVTVGTAGFTPVRVGTIHLVLDNSGNPYISYYDASVTAQNVVVMKFNGTNWVALPATTAGIGDYSFALDSANIPYILYSNTVPTSIISAKATLLKYNGTAWQIVGLDNFTAGSAVYPQLIFDNNNVPCITYQDGANNGKVTVMKYISNTWTGVGTAIPFPGSSSYPSLKIDKKTNTPFVTCYNTNAVVGVITMKYNGSAWVQVGNSYVSYNGCNRAQMALDNNSIPYVIYDDYANESKVTVKKFNGNDWDLLGEKAFSPSIVQYTSIVVDANGIPYAAFKGTDVTSNSDRGISVMKYNGNSWDTVGARHGASRFATNIVTDYVTLALNNNGVPYVAYQDPSNGYKATVVKYSGSQWDTIGGLSISSDQALNLSLTVDKNSMPYVAYKNETSGGGITVYKYNGIKWDTVGRRIMSGPTAAFTPSIVCDNAGTPYIVYTDVYQKATVKKFNGTTWVTVGIADFTANQVDKTTLAIDAAGTPYIAFFDYGVAYKGSVMKFDGTNWVNVGIPGFTLNGAIGNISIAIDAAGLPYVTYTAKNSYNNSVSVMKFDGANWVSIGQPVISESNCEYASISLNNIGTPYIVYGSGGAWAKGVNEKIVSTNSTQALNINPPFSGLFKIDSADIAIVKPAAVNGISGNTTAKVWIENTQPVNFVKRHYQITPDANATTAAARVTLYFTQQDFDDFNNQNPAPAFLLPQNPNDIAGKANLLIEKRGGVSSTGTGLPDTYTGTTTIINPDDKDIVWNAIGGFWEVSFDVTGFSGFFIETPNSTVPIQWLNVTGNINNKNNAVISWKVNENNIEKYIIEKSNDGKNFTAAGTVNSLGNGTHAYQFTHPLILTGINYFRIQQIDKDGKQMYSKVITLNAEHLTNISLYPQPAKDILYVDCIEGIKTITIFSSTGKQIGKYNLNSINKSNINVADLNKGFYILRIETGNGEIRTEKLIIQ